MKTITADIQEPYYSFILSGEKTIEGRLNKGKFKDLEIGDIININFKVNCVVTSKRLYTSFIELLDHEGFKKIIPDVHDLKSAYQAYMKYYTKEQEKTYGTIAIGIKLQSKISQQS